MNLFVLNEQNSIANQFLAELRDREIQRDRQRFRRNMEKLGEIMAYEISKKLDYAETVTQTPLGSWRAKMPARQPVLITVLRAGLPFYQGFLHYFDQADSGFVGAWRKEDSDDITINLDYLATPDLNGRQLILIDPMLATGKSIIKSLHALQRNGTPAATHIAALVAAPEGLKFLEQHLSLPATVYVGAIDEKLNDKFYIVPGLGDAGDLSFGEKL